MASYSSLALGGRVQQSTLNENEILAYSSEPAHIVLLRVIRTLLKLVHVGAIRVDCWRQDKVSRLIFDLDVSVTSGLLIAMRQADSENSFPRKFP